MLSTREPPQNKGHRLKVKGWRKIFYEYSNQNESSGDYK